MLPRSWKKSFDNGIKLPTKMRRCNECKNGIFYNEYINQINETNEFEANLNEIKKQLFNQFGHMLSYYKKN